MSKKLPAFQFYPGDWMKDPALRRCSHAAKGVLMDVLCFMFESHERGVLVTDGTPWSDEEIALAVGGHADVTLMSLRELLDKGVLRRRSDGAIFSSRMVRDEQERVKARKRKQKERENVTTGQCHDASHADVTDDVTPLSHCSSSSSSTSVNRESERRARALDDDGGLLVDPPVDPQPPTLQVIVAFGMTAGIPPEVCEWFFNDMESSGWRNRHGQPIRKWQPLLMNMNTRRRESEHLRTQSRRGGSPGQEQSTEAQRDEKRTGLKQTFNLKML